MHLRLDQNIGGHEGIVQKSLHTCKPPLSSAFLVVGETKYELENSSSFDRKHFALRGL